MAKLLPGISACFAIAVPSWFLGRAFPVVGGPVFSILIGILCVGLFPGLVEGAFLGRVKLGDGIKYTSKKLLQYSIVLLGFEMDLFHAAEVGRQSVFVMAFTLTAAFVAAFALGKMLKPAGDTALLVGVGTAICGGSAIAAAASVLRAKDEDVVRSISTIFLFNIIAVFIFPFLGRAMGMSDTGFGMWAGTAINDTSSVVAAGTAWSDAAGSNAALQFATVVKLTRTLVIVPICLFLAVYTSRKQKRENAGGFNFVKVFPWFVVFFVAATVINTFAPIPVGVTGGLASIGKFVIVMAMAGIGLNTNLKSLLSNGLKPILLGLCCWASVAAASIAVQGILGIL
jgi:uncharacterized integral membrane protein (TIGR00698 family)